MSSGKASLVSRVFQDKGATTVPSPDIGKALLVVRMWAARMGTGG